MTISKFIEESVEKFGDKIFLIDYEPFRKKKYSYNKIYSQSISLVNYFSKNNLKKGDKIIIYLNNSSDYVSLLFACAISGVIAVPIDINNNIEFVEEISKKVKAKIIFCSLYKSPKNGNVFFKEKLSDIYEEFSKSIKINFKIKEEDIFEIVYTSGTTSNPKGVVITNKNLASNIKSAQDSFTDLSDLNILSILPLSHLFEQNAGLFTPMILGTKIVYTSSRKSSTIIKVINQERISEIITVPLFLQTIKEKIENEAKKKNKLNTLYNAIKKYENTSKFIKKIVFSKIRKNLGNLNLFLVGGAPLENETEKFWRSIGIDVLQGYGLTESSPLLTVNTLKKNKVGSVGIPVSGVEIKIIDDEIVAKGDNIFSSYFENEIETNRIIKDGWLYTGDIGKFDDEGFLFITGRKKNMILSSSGLNIYPEDIEKTLNSNDKVKDSYVTSLDGGKSIIGVILTKEKININELLASTNKKLSPHQYLKKIIIWHKQDFPRTPTLKIKRGEIETYLKSQRIESKNIFTEDKLIKIIAEICKPSSKINEDSILANIGLDSIKRIELSVAIEENFNIDFNEDSIDEKTTIKKLRSLIKENENIDEESGINYFNSKKFNFIRFPIQVLGFLFTKAFYSLQINGLENIPENENVIFIANHSSHLDTLTVLRALPVKIRMNTYTAGAKDFFFEKNGKYGRIIGNIGRLTLNAFAFSRTTNIKQSLKDFGDIIDKGGNILIYPEGTRSLTGEMNPFKSGIGLLAWNMDTKIIPVKMSGLFEVFPKGAKSIRKGNAKIIFGKPIKIDKLKSYNQITKELENEVKKLK